MKRTKQQQLEYESILAFRNQLPSSWIVRGKDPDVGIDLEIEIVEGEDVTNNVLWIQMKATETVPNADGDISYQMETKHLKYYEGCKLPVIIVFGIKKSNLNFDFYILFAQQYIKEHLDKDKPDWREQKTVAIMFKSKLQDTNELDNFATNGFFYIVQQLTIPAEAQYWLNGISQSEKKEIKARTLKAIRYIRAENYHPVIKELESILEEYKLTETEEVSILLLLGNAYYSINNYDKAMEKYEKAKEITGE